MEWKLFEGETSEFITKEWYEPRDAAHHLEDGHGFRLERAFDFVAILQHYFNIETVSDLGSGDGGLLQLIKERLPNVRAWGYDMAPKNVEYAVNTRGVDVRYTDFTEGVEYGDVSILTEVLEHVVDPGEILRTVPSKYIVASSPHHETAEDHYEFHLWAWDNEGYRDLFERNGWNVLFQENVEWSQLIVATRA